MSWISFAGKKDKTYEALSNLASGWIPKYQQANTVHAFPPKPKILQVKVTLLFLPPSNVRMALIEGFWLIEAREEIQTALKII